MVLSQLNGGLTETAKNEFCTSNAVLFHGRFCFYYLLSSMLKSCGYSVSNFRIQKISLSIS